MPPALKVKQFGLPRWVWIAALAGGIGVGLYIRSRRAEQEAASGIDPDEYSPESEAEAQAALEGMSYNGLEGLPVGFYDAISGADAQYLPDAVGEDTTDPIIVNIDLNGKPKPGGKRVAKPKPKPGKRGPRGPKGRPGKPGKPRTGGGPPKRPGYRVRGGLEPVLKNGKKPVMQSRKRPAPAKRRRKKVGR